MLLLLVSWFSAAGANTVEQRLQKIERQMGQLSALMLEVQQLRTELQQNFGLVEEALHQQKQIKRKQSEHYLDLEARIRKLERATQSTAPTASSNKAAAAGQSGGGEYDAYNKAFALVRANRTDKALTALNQLISDFPGGDFNGDAWYWIGRLHTVNGDKKAASRAYGHARSILEQVVKSAPGSSQAERASMKLKKIP